MTWVEFWALFHRRWGSDHESPEYQKSEWNEMQRFLESVDAERGRGDLPSGQNEDRAQ